MPTIELLGPIIVNGMLTSRSFLQEQAESRQFTIIPDFSNNFDSEGHPLDLFSDPTFSYVLKMFISLDPRRAECVGEIEWPNPQSIRDTAWPGFARRVWATLETSRGVTASLQLRY